MELKDLFDRLMLLTIDLHETRAKANILAKAIETQLEELYKRDNNPPNIKRGPRVYSFGAIVCRIKTGITLGDAVKYIMSGGPVVEVTFVYFLDGKLTSWQKSKIRDEKDRLNREQGAYAHPDYGKHKLWITETYLVGQGEAKTVKFKFGNNEV